jgi:hypothetical protein
MQTGANRDAVAHARHARDLGSGHQAASEQNRRHTGWLENGANKRIHKDV